MYKAIQDSLGFWVDSNFCHWNLNSGFQSLAGFLQLYPGFQIPQANIYRIPLLGVIYASHCRNLGVDHLIFDGEVAGFLDC